MSHDEEVAAYRYITADLRTGAVLAELPLVGARISEALSEPASLSATLPLFDVTMPIADLKAATAEAKTALFVDLGGQLLWGGIIWKTVPRRHSLSLTCGDFLSYYAKRKITTSRVFTGVDQFTIVRTLLADAAAKPGGDIGIVLGTNLSGRTRDAEFIGSERRPLLQTIQEMAADANGFDLAVSVAYDTNGVPVKYLQLGDPLGQPASSTNLLLEYPGNVSDYEWATEGDRLATTLYVRGEGSGDLTPFAVRENTSLIAAGYPLLEEEIPAAAGTVLQTDLQAQADANAAAYGAPVLLPTFTIPAGVDDPQVHTYRPGDVFRVRISDAEWWPANVDGVPGFDGYMRLTARTITPAEAGSGQSVELTFAPVPGTLPSAVPIGSGGGTGGAGGGGVPTPVRADPTLTLSQLAPAHPPIIGEDVTVQVTATVDPALSIASIVLTKDGVPVPLTPALPSAGPFTFTYHVFDPAAPAPADPTVTVARVSTAPAPAPAEVTAWTEDFETGPAGASIVGASGFTGVSGGSGTATFTADTPFSGALAARYSSAAPASGAVVLDSENFENGVDAAAISTSNSVFDGYSSATGTATFSAASPFTGALFGRYESTGGGSTADFTENFEGGTNGAAISTANTGFGGFGSGSGSAVFSNATPLTGLGSLFGRFSSVGSQAISVYKTLAAAAGTYATSFYVRFAANPAANVQICSARRAGTPPGTPGLTVAASIRLQTDGKLILRDAAVATGAASTTTLSTNTWYRLEWKLIGATSQELRIYAGSGTTPLETMAGRALTAADMDNFLYGLTVAVTDWQLDIDAVQQAPDFPGPWTGGGASQAVSTFLNLPLTRDSAALGVHGRIAAFPPAVTAIATARGPANELRGSLRINTTGKLEMRDGTSTVDTSVASLPLDSWWRVDWRVDDTTGTQEARLYLAANVEGAVPDEVLTGAYQAGAAVGSVANYSLGIINAVAAWHLDLDAIQVADTYPGPWPGAQSIGTYRNLAAASSDVTLSFFGRFADVPPAAAFPVVARLGTAIAGGIRINADRSITIRNGAASVVSSAAGLLPVGQWWRLDWRCNFTAGTQELRVFLGANVNGATPDAVLAPGAASFTTSTVDNFNMGIVTALATWHLDVDAIRVLDAAWPQPWGATAGGTGGPADGAPVFGDPVTVAVNATVADGLAVSSLVLYRDGAEVARFEPNSSGTYTYIAGTAPTATGVHFPLTFPLTFA